VGTLVSTGLHDGECHVAIAVLAVSGGLHASELRQSRR
jgi:hypothetical protein